MPECLICAESFDKTARRAVQCEYCPSTACRKCCETYILGQTEPHCMDTACMRTWTRKFMSSTFTNAWLSTEYKAHCAQTLYDTERVLFPATQNILQHDRRIRELTQERERIINECKRRVLEIDLRLRLLRLRHEATGEQAGNPVAEPENTTPVAVHPCIYDGCRGYMSSQWKCGMCDKHACAHCHKPKAAHTDESHICNPDDVASVAAIKKETRPCPKCHVQIFKIHGCDQMWCVNCNTAFSWQRGTVVTGPIHNPHYHEYLARTRGRPGDRQAAPVGVFRCGYDAVPHWLDDNIIGVILAAFPVAIQGNPNLLDLHRVIRHVAHVEVVQSLRPDQVNVELRKRFLRNEIDEKQFKRQSLANHKANQRKGELCQVAEMVRDALSEIYIRMDNFIREKVREEQGTMRTPKPENQWSKASMDSTREQLSKYIEEVAALQSYANECVENINAVYASTSKKRFNYKFEMEVPPK